MPKRGTDRVKSTAREATKGQLATLIGVAGMGLAKAGFSFDEMQVFLGNKSRTEACIARALRNEHNILAKYAPLVREQVFWAKLGVSVAIEDLTMPDLPTDLTEIAIIPAHLSAEQLFALCQKYFPSWKYHGNLDEVSAEQVRPTGTYVIGYRGGIEPDSVHLGKSYDVAMKEELIFMNPKERMVAELRYAVPDGVYLHHHLDVKGISILSSLAAGGGAFCVSWRPGSWGFHVYGYFRSYVDSGHGPRQVVLA